ncbi:hypothetical protein AFLA_010090 [Aspergillus flavus NRRL3357]|nr:hypothetical protein AFLA_010090 [Aspergillus flavus NRRL3357]
MDDVDIQRFSPLSAIPHKKDFPSPQRTPDIVTKHRHRFDLPSLICLKIQYAVGQPTSPDTYISLVPPPQPKTQKWPNMYSSNKRILTV